MPTTSNFGWTTPSDTDLVKDGASAIRTLGNNIDASLVDLKGGTTGQVLAKNSNTDLDYTWTNVDPLTILDAKGDLISATAADTPARLAVGTDGQILTADSTASTGIKWAAPAGGGQAQYPSVTSTSWMSNFVSGTTGSTTITLNRTYYIPIVVPTTTLDRINVKTGSGFSGTATTRLGLYANSSSNKPATLLLDAGTVAMSAASTNYEITISKAVSAGLIWVAVNQQAQSGTPQMNTVTGANFATDGTILGASSSIIGGTRGLYYIQSSVTGAFADAVSPTIAATPATMQVDLRNA